MLSEKDLFFSVGISASLYWFGSGIPIWIGKLVMLREGIIIMGRYFTLSPFLPSSMASFSSFGVV